MIVRHHRSPLQYSWATDVCLGLVIVHGYWESGHNIPGYENIAAICNYRNTKTVQILYRDTVRPSRMPRAEMFEVEGNRLPVV